MTRSAGIRALFAAAALCVPVAGCGDDDVGDPIPASTVDSLEQQLDAIQADVRQSDCDGATTAIAELRTDVDGLDDHGVGRDVQDAIDDGVENLSSLAAQECEPEEEPVETVPETVPEETITETTPEPTTPEPTTPEPTTPEPTTPEPTPEEEPDETDGGAQFDPNADAPGQQKKDGD